MSIEYEYWQDRFIFIERDGFSWTDETGDLHFEPGKTREQVREIMTAYANFLGEYNW